MGGRYNDVDMSIFEEEETLKWKQPIQRENRNVYTNNGLNPPTQKKNDILNEFDPVNKNRYNDSYGMNVFIGEEKEASNWKNHKNVILRENENINHNKGKDQTREEIMDELERESDDTDPFNYDDIEAIWRLPVDKEEYTANFNSIDTFNISGGVGHNNDKSDKHKKQDLNEFDPINKSNRVRETRHNKNSDNINLNDDEEKDTLARKQQNQKEVNNNKQEFAWKQKNQIMEVKNVEHEEKKELALKQQNQKIEVHYNGYNNVHEKKEPLLQKQQTQKINDLITDFDPYNESDRVRGEKITNSSPINNRFDISVWKNFYKIKNDDVDNKPPGEIPVSVNKHVQTQKKGEIIFEFDPLSKLDTVRETNHNKSDNKHDVNLADDEEKDALEWKQHPIKKSEKNDDANNEHEKKGTTLSQEQLNHDEIINEFDPYNTSDKNRDANMRVNKASSWRMPEDDDVPTRNNNPDATWNVPSQFSPFELLGERRIHLKRIQANTNTHMNHNRSEGRIEIWGSSEEIEEAKKQLNEQVNSLLGFTREHEHNRKNERSSESTKSTKEHGLNRRNIRVTKGKIYEFYPESASVKKNNQEPELERKEQELELERKEQELELERKEQELELERKERKEQELELKRKEQELELKRKEQELELELEEEQEHDKEIYLKRPDYLQKFPFNEFFIFPTTDIHISRFLGLKDEVLNPVRLKYRCHIWHDSSLPGSNIIKIVGNSRESVELATTRVKNLFIKTLASRTIPHSTQVAESLLGIHHMIEQPHDPCEIRIADPSPRFYLLYLPNFKPEVKLIKPVYIQSELYFDFFHIIRESNLKRIEDSLLKALETIHLLDEEIKMRVRFGHVCFTRVPLAKDFSNDATLTINQINDKVLKKARTESKFATRIATEQSQLDGLIEVLSGSDLGWFSTPSREFKIHATRKTSDKEWPCAFEIQLRNGNKNKHKYDGKIGLWSAIIHERNVLDINMSCLANEYSWKLQIKTAKRFTNSPPQENFINGLRTCPQGRLIYSNTKDINVVSVYEKTKWKYQWNSDYIVEVVKYEFWELSKYNDIPDLEVYLREEPLVVSYGVNFYKKSWDEKFALNLDLDVGEAPEWHPQDIMDDLMDKEQTESVSGLMNDIQTFLNVLEIKVPIPSELYDDT